MATTGHSCQRRLKATVFVRESVRRRFDYAHSSGTSVAIALFRALELSAPTEMMRWSVCSHTGVLTLQSTTIEALHTCQAKSSSLNLGFSPLCAAGVIPLSMLARAARKETLLDALRWSADRVTSGELPTDSILPGQDLSTEYLYRLRSIAHLSPWVCAVTMGVDVEVAKILCVPEFDRLTLEMFLRHFALKLRFRGGTEVIGAGGSSQVQERFCDYLLSKGVGRRLGKLRLLRAMFGYRPEVSRTSQPLQDEKIVPVVNRLCETFMELRLTEKTMSRLLCLILGDVVTAKKLARSLRWQICLMETEKIKHAPTPHGEVKDVLLQMVRSMILDALGNTYTAEDVVEVFIVVCLLCLRTLPIDLVSGREGFWIPWFEQQLYPFLANLTQGSSNEDKLCGESKKLSAKSNL